MTRLTKLPQNYLSSYISQLEQALQALKSSNSRTAGSSLVYKQSDSGNQYDWSGTLPPVSGDGSAPFKNFLVTASAGVQANLLADLVWYMFINGTRVSKADWLANGKWNYSISQMPKSGSTPNEQQWLAYVYGVNSTDTVSVKAYVLATDAVSISVVPQ